MRAKKSSFRHKRVGVKWPYLGRITLSRLCEWSWHNQSRENTTEVDGRGQRRPKYGTTHIELSYCGKDVVYLTKYVTEIKTITDTVFLESKIVTEKLYVS